MGTLAYRLVRDDFMLFIAGNDELSESEWNDYLVALTEAATRLRPARRPLNFLCFVEDARPDAKQRAAVIDALLGVPSKTAVITTSLLARNVITVFNWLGLNVKGFAPAAFDKVSDYLDLPSTMLEQTLALARVLASSIGGGVGALEAVERARYSDRV